MPNKMKAVVATGYGSPEVLQLRKVNKPQPNKNEVLIKIHATSVTASDVLIRGLNAPLIYKLTLRERGLKMLIFHGVTLPL